MENGSLMKVESIEECSPWSILQYFLSALSSNENQFLVFILSGRLGQVLLYSDICKKTNESSHKTSHMGLNGAKPIFWVSDFKRDSNNLLSYRD